MMKAQRWRFRVLRVSNPYLQISPKTRTLYLWTKKVSEPNFGVADLWILSSYLDAQGKERKEYQVTKKGEIKIAL